ncbi:hypothetical protein KY289_007593 [Solanum tuberosum]|nr:hypothetical protein KY289_007593 [Solanum tuberosum]
MMKTVDLNLFAGDILPCKIKKLSPNIKKLILIRTFIPWEVMKLLANLPNLEVLKLERAFDGKDWKLDEDVVFHKLKYLKLYAFYDLLKWEEAGSDNFPMLEQLILDWIIQLEEIPESICHAPSLHPGWDRHLETIAGPKRTLGLAFLTQRKPDSTE